MPRDLAASTQRLIYCPELTDALGPLARSLARSFGEIVTLAGVDDGPCDADDRPYACARRPVLHSGIQVASCTPKPGIRKGIEGAQLRSNTRSRGCVALTIIPS